MTTAAAHGPSAARPVRVRHGRRPWLTNLPVHRQLQFALAAAWILDGALQLQPYMFTRSFATDTLASTAQGNPEWVAACVQWAASIVAAHPAATNIVFALTQLGLGIGILLPRTARPALGASIIWALSVWWFGEGAGGVFLPGASAMRGAPGAALLYAVLAVLLWPGRGRPALAVRRSAPVRAWRKVLWVVLWGGLAAMNLTPANLAPNAVHAVLHDAAQSQPGWLRSIIADLAQASAGHGTALTLLGTLAMILIAAGIFLPTEFARGAVVLAVLAAVFIWVFGEGLGGLTSGTATDPNSGPLLALIALSFWPTARERQHGPVGTPRGATESASSTANPAA